MRRCAAHVLALLLGAIIFEKAYAEDTPAPLTGSVTLVSDYRYRGLSLSHGQPEAQGELTYVSPPAFYVDLFGSSLNFLGAHEELDLTAGKRTHLYGFDVDVGITRFTFFGAKHLDYLELPVSASRSWGAWAWTGGVAYAPPQVGTNNRSNTYAFGRAGWSSPTSPYSCAASVGFEDGAFARHKTDWSLSGTRRLPAIFLSLSLLGYHQGKSAAALVGSVGAGF